MAEQMSTLTIAEIQSELLRMNDALKQVVEGYETLSRRVQEYVLSEPDLADRYEGDWWEKEPDLADRYEEDWWEKESESGPEKAEEEEKIEVSFDCGEPSFGRETVFMAAAVVDQDGLERELHAQCFINPDDPRQDYDYLKEVITEQAMARAGIGADRLVFGEFTDFVRSENVAVTDRSGEAEPGFTEKTEPSTESESPEHEKPR